MSSLELTPFEQELLKSAAAPRDLPSWASEMASEGAARFAQNGLPNRRVEAWKYTDLRTKLRGTVETESSPVDVSIDLAGAFKVTLSDKGLTCSEPLPDGVGLVSLSEALASKGEFLQSYMGKTKAMPTDAMSGLNAALMESGFVLHVAEGTHVQKPIILRNEMGESGASVFIRNLVVLGEGASATLVEEWTALTSAPILRQAVTEVHLGGEANLSHLRVQNEALSSSPLSLVAVDVYERATYQQFALTLGAGLSRNETHVKLLGEEAHVDLGGTFLLSGSQHGDTTTVVTHAVPNCTCREVFRGVMTDRSRGVFQGKISVSPQAQKTDAKMETRALLLSDRAEMDAKPELEIYADDVKCAHGATIGTLDEGSIFYLQSRGIPRDEARRMLIAAFVEQSLDVVSNEDLKAMLRHLIAIRLSTLEGVAG